MIQNREEKAQEGKTQDSVIGPEGKNWLLFRAPPPDID